MIISLVLDVLICISLLAVQVSMMTLLAEPVDGISSDSSQAALRSSIRTINDGGPSRAGTPVAYRRKVFSKCFHIIC